MENDFQLLLTKTLNKDNDAWQRLLFVSGTFIKTWARRNQIELSWMAADNQLTIINIELQKLIEKYLNDIDPGEIPTMQFADFKAWLVQEFIAVNKRCFFAFTEQLKKNDEAAWKQVSRLLEIKSASWFYKRWKEIHEDHHDIFCSSIEILYTRIVKGKMSFEDSRSFKSYFFKILENKTLEELKNTYKKRVVTQSENQLLVFMNEDVTPLYEEEKRQLVKTALQKLNMDEQDILTCYFFEEKKLKDIALEIGLSEENVRIKKYRALQKLSTYFKVMGYEP